MNMKLTRTILLLFSLTLSVAGLGAQEQSDSSAVVLSPADTLENSDSAGMFNALDYSMQSRYIERGEPFIENKFSDNTFLSVHGGSEKLSPRGNSTYNWSAAAKISFGKWFNPYNALRVTLAGERTFRNNDRSVIWSAGLDISHMFNMSRYFGGYKPSRFLEISTVEGLRYRYSMTGGEGTSAAGLHLGFNFNMNLGGGMDFFVEPLATFYSDNIDHSARWNWHRYDITYGGTMGLSYRFHSHKPYRTGPSDTGNAFVSLSAGPAFHYADLVMERMGLFKSLGAQVNISYGKWFTPVFALRATGFFTTDKWIAYGNGDKHNAWYYGARVEGMLELVSLFRGGNKADFSLPLLFGPEIACVTKRESTRNINNFYLGLTGGFQLKYRILEYISIFMEPRITIVPYTIVNVSEDPLKHVGHNYYDTLYNLNFGIELDLGFLQ